MNKTTQQFIEEAQRIHGDAYDYSLVNYVHSMKKVKIVCPIHGRFLKTPNNHISSKSGCPKCSKKYRPSTGEFVNDMKQIHGNKYDYSLVDYVNNKTKVTVGCTKHGPFEITPANHRNGIGCCKCANETKGAYHKRNTKWFIEEAQRIHKSKYDYSQVRYQRCHSKVEIICLTHGRFFQTPGSHIHGENGCPRCAAEKVEGGYGIKRFQNHPEIKDQLGYLYVIELFDKTENFIKIGVTRQIEKRFDHQIPYSHNLLRSITGKLYKLFLKEQLLKKQFKSRKYRPQTKFCGHTECFDFAAKEALLEEVK